MITELDERGEEGLYNTFQDNFPIKESFTSLLMSRIFETKKCKGYPYGTLKKT